MYKFKFFEILTTKKTIAILGFFFNEKLYKENSFSILDLFDEWPDEHLNRTKIEVKTIQTFPHGVCFTLSFSNEVLLVETAEFVIKRSWDILVYIHNKGEEFWLLLEEFPIIVSSLRIEINTR